MNSPFQVEWETPQKTAHEPQKARLWIHFLNCAQIIFYNNWTDIIKAEIVYACFGFSGLKNAMPWLPWKRNWNTHKVVT